jgi:hypothetical protein
LGKNVKLKFGISLTSIEFGLRLSKISILGGIIEISGYYNGDLVIEGEA